MDTDVPAEVNAIYKQLKKQWGQIKQHSEQVSPAQHMGMCRTHFPCVSVCADVAHSGCPVEPQKPRPSKA